MSGVDLMKMCFSEGLICLIFLPFKTARNKRGENISYHPIPCRDSISRPITPYAETIPRGHAARDTIV
jgi:hypothetical protein